MLETVPTTSLTPVDRPQDAIHATIAPAWHTTLLILLVLGPLIQATVVERRNPGAALHSPAIVPLLLTGALVQSIFLLFAWWGVRLRNNSFRTLVGAGWPSRGEFGRDLGFALGFWVLWYGVLSLVKLGLASAGITNAGISGMVYPSGTGQMILWILNAMLAGVVEETVFRGYLLKQFTAWFRSTPLALVAQAILFGVAHGYLFGLRQVILIAVSGILIGVFVLWRRNLRSAMAFHAWADIFGSVIVRGLPFQ